MSAYEYHTITVDTVGQASANTWTSFLQTPLHNVVEVELLACHVHTTDATEHLYIKIDELDSNFNDRAAKAGDNATTGQGEISRVSGAFDSLVSESTAGGTANIVFVFKQNYPMKTEFKSPVRTIDRFTCTLLNQEGVTIKNSATAGNNFLVLRAKLAKTNL